MSKWISLKSRAAIGIFFLLCIVVAFPFIRYYFGNFYVGSWQEYKIWYPRLFFIIFPLIKILPFAVLGILLFLLCDVLLGFFKIIREIPYQLLHISVFIKKVILKYAASVLLLAVTLAILLSISEYALRKQGLKPGYRLYSIYFKPVDSLYSIEGFYADSNGIFCVSQSAREYIANELKTKNSPLELTPYKENQSPEIYSLSEDFLELLDTCFSNEFKSFIEKIDSEEDTSEHDFYAAVKQYLINPINSNGFKSIEFKKYDSKRKSILLLGDSFTWGHSTSNKTNCFADLLLAKGYIVYNTGISGTDPGQYLLLAKFLIPQLRPDYVLVNFFMGNDIQYFDRDPQPFTPVFYSTNAGNLVSCPEGVYLNSAEEAYDYTLTVFTIPVQHNRFNRFCAKTVLGTLLWRALDKLGIADATLPRFMEYTKKAKSAETTYPFSDTKLRQIQEVAQAHKVNFLLLAIPALEGNKFVYPENHAGLFEELQYFVPPVKKEFYNALDGHFNDKGSKEYADFIDSLLNAE